MDLAAAFQEPLRIGQLGAAGNSDFQTGLAQNERTDGSLVPRTVTESDDLRRSIQAFLAPGSSSASRRRVACASAVTAAGYESRNESMSVAVGIVIRLLEKCGDLPTART